MLLLFQTSFSLVKAAVVCAVLESISGLEPSSDTTLVKYQDSINQSLVIKPTKDLFGTHVADDLLLSSERLLGCTHCEGPALLCGGLFSMWSDYSKQVEGQFIRLRPKIAKKCCLYMDIFSCVKINVFRFQARDACQMR